MTTTYEQLSPEDVHRICGEGDGESIGLPCVPDDKLDDVIARARHAFDTHSFDCLCMICALYSIYCVECDTAVPDMDPEDEDHVIAMGCVLIGCEGFHTAVFRAAQFITNE